MRRDSETLRLLARLARIAELDRVARLADQRRRLDECEAVASALREAREREEAALDASRALVAGTDLEAIGRWRDGVQRRLEVQAERIEGARADERAAVDEAADGFARREALQGLVGRADTARRRHLDRRRERDGEPG